MQDSPEIADATNVEPMRLYEMIGPIELAGRLTLPETWVRDRTRLYSSTFSGAADYDYREACNIPTCNTTTSCLRLSKGFGPS